MAKRNTVNPSSLEGVYARLEELLLASSGEDEFEEILKILTLQLWSESVVLKIDIFNNMENGKIIEYANEQLGKISTQWPGVLRDTKINISSDQMKACFLLLSNFRFLSYGFDEIDALFEYIVSKEKKGAKGQFFTPRYIINHCINLAKPQNGETIIDPAAGSSAFLYNSARYINRNLIEEKSDARYNLFAFDFDDKAIRISKLLMYVAGIENLKINRVNSLITSKSQQSLFTSKAEDTIMTIEDYLRLSRLETKVDLILTNPPFAGEVNEEELIENYEVAQGKKKIERDILFIERCINILKPGGRMVIILPDNVFGSRDNIFVREWIYSKARIVGVIGLPRNTFMPHTPVKTSILLLKKRTKKAKLNEEVFFGISEQAGKNSRGVLQYLKGKERIMENVAHDLSDIENEFNRFISEDKERWI